MKRTIFTDISEFEARLNLPTGFYEQLVGEDDWSFVIKLSSLFEGACTHVLTAHLNRPELSNALAHLDMANAKYGKLVLLRTLGAITTEQFNVLKELAELRNKLVHNVANVAFNFDTFFVGLDANQSKAKAKLFGHGLQDSLQIGGKRVSSAQFVLENPKLSIWLTGAEVLACLYLDIEAAQLKLQLEAIERYKQLALLPSTTATK